MAKQGKNLLYVVAYLLTWLTGLIVYLTSKKGDTRTRFHALQAIFLGIIILILAFIPLINILGVVLWIIGIIVGVIAYNGRDISLPIIGDWARKYSK